MKKEEMNELKNLLAEYEMAMMPLGGCLQEEKEALIKDDMKALTGIVEKKVKCVEQLDELEGRRLTQYQQITLEYLDLILLEESDDDDELQALAVELKEQMRRIQNLGRQLAEEQETNSLLIQQSKAYGDMMMDMIQTMIKKAGTYGKGGTIASAPVKAGFDTSV